MADDPKKILRELVDEVLDEMTGTGAVAGYATPHAFRGNKSKKKAAERSMPGGKVVGTEDETDGTTIGINEEDRLPILRRSIGEGRYRNFKTDESMKSHTKVCFGISEAKKMLREVEFLVSIVERLKSEDGVDKAQLWKRTKKDLSEINKRTKAIARRVYRIGKQ
jgi:hypothetical protein